jgi:hypothetical protein
MFYRAYIITLVIALIISLAWLTVATIVILTGNAAALADVSGPLVELLRTLADPLADLRA